MTTIKITNQAAADEARALSLDVIETVLAAFARLPKNIPVGAALASVHVRLREVETRHLRVQHPYETAEVTADHDAMAGPDHELVVTELTRFRTAELREGLTIEQTTHQREVVLADLTERREKLARPWACSAPSSEAGRRPGVLSSVLSRPTRSCGRSPVSQCPRPPSRK